jgi:hypothetical protein
MTSSRELVFSVRVDPRRLLVRMAFVIALLVLGSTVAVGALAYFRWSEGSLGHEMVKLFWLDTEQNLPTLYQFIALASASVLMFHISEQPGLGVLSDRKRWQVLGGTFAFLAIDEVARIHETVGDTSSFNFGAAGLLIYVPVVLGLALWWLPLYLRLDRRSRVLLLLSALLYVGGAAGVESLSQWYEGTWGKATPLYVVLATIEEALEMLGIAVLIYALLEYLRGLQSGMPDLQTLSVLRNETT